VQSLAEAQGQPAPNPTMIPFAQHLYEVVSYNFPLQHAMVLSGVKHEQDDPMMHSELWVLNRETSVGLA
jgi:hypothetical protein